MNWIITEDITSVNKLRINFNPPNKALTMFFASLKTIDLSDYLSQTIHSEGGFGLENASILFYNQMDWEDKENLDINEGDVVIYAYDGATNTSIIKEIEFDKIIYDFAFSLLKTNHAKYSLSESSFEKIKHLLDELKIKLSKKHLKSPTEINKNVLYNFFDGLKLYQKINQYYDWLSSDDYAIWSNSYVELNNKRIYIIKENAKVLSTFRFYSKEELESLSSKYNLQIREQDGIYYLGTETHNTEHFQISENNELIVIYCTCGSYGPESIFIYGVYEK